RKTTAYGVPRASPKVGVQAKVPDVCAGLEVNVALFPTGSPAGSKVSAASGSPSASEAVTVTLTGVFSREDRNGGAFTRGGMSRTGAQLRFRSTKRSLV